MTSVVHSSSRCFGGTVSLLKSQERDVNYGDVIDTEAFENILNNTFNDFEDFRDVIWIAPVDYFKLDEDSACATSCKGYQLFYNSYILIVETLDLYTESLWYEVESEIRNGALFECHTCTSHNNSIPGLGPLESSSSETYIVSNILHRLGYYDQLRIAKEGDDIYYALKNYSGRESEQSFANYLGNVVMNDTLIPFNARDGISFQAKLHPAHLVARLPLLAILGAETQLPKVTKIAGASERLFIDVRLNVKLKEPITVLVCIFGGQVLAIGAVIFYCRNVFIRDYASSLSIARLLKKTTEDTEGMSTHTGEELAEYLDSKGVMMRYGTRRKGDEAFEVDLWNDVEDEFPDAIYA
ncbi:hypothetical protein COCMIDRAFT_29323 [Bipolaris oryzae ATCC 44560]|uniref:Uncharacterized protein n=1 Tax=Bipolaris oryzae ATCC 44560 TaxID=930090 RepID=W6YWP0_COCMI|nr:uncharacterized protein COCMIDRAFT_29323 [Bipolaris oryzae ATCC 44560]EUC41965.1 hypothetical protein COCMIDRAFT_29323 [Bipolaris oryzae ATCC 44560]